MFLSFLITLFLATPVNAQEHAITPVPTAVPTLTQTTTASNTDTLDEIQKIREAVQQKVQEKLQSITNPQAAKKGWIGTITAIDVDRLTLSYNNTPRQVSFDPNTAFINSKRQKTTYDKFTVGQSVLAMGEVGTDNALSATRIVATDLTTITSKQIVIGKIADISKSSPIFVIIPIQDKNLQYQVKTDTNTKVVSKTGSKLDFKVLTAGQKAIAILKQDPKNPKSYTALQIVALEAVVSPTPTAKPTK